MAADPYAAFQDAAPSLVRPPIRKAPAPANDPYAHFDDAAEDDGLEADIRARREAGEENPFRSAASTLKRGFIGLPGFAGDAANIIGNIGNKLDLPQYEFAGPDLPHGNIWDTALDAINPFNNFRQVERQAPDTYAGVVTTGRDVNAIVDHGVQMAEQIEGVPGSVPGMARDAAKTFGSKSYAETLDRDMTDAEKIGAALGSVAPAAIAPGGIVTRAARVIGPGLASEGAGRVAQDIAPEWETEARVMGAMLGSFAGEKTIVPTARAIDRAPGVRAVNAAPQAIGRALVDGFSRVTPDFNAMGMSGGNVRSAPPAPPVPNTQQSTRQAVGGRAMTLAKRDKLTPEKWDERLGKFQEAGVTPTMAQMLGEPGLTETKALVSQPGQTASVAKEIVKAQRAGVQPLALNAIDEALGTTTRAASLENLEAMRTAMRPEYEAALKDAKLSGANIDGERFGPIIDPIVRGLSKSEQTELSRFIEGERSRYGGREFSDGQELHLTRMKLGEMIAEAEAKGTDAFRRREMSMVRDNLTKAMGEEIPGYKSLNDRWRTVEQAEDAVSWGADILGRGKRVPRPDEVAREFEAMPPLAKEYARVGVRNELNRMMSERPVDHATLTNFLESGELQNKLRLIMGEGEANALIGKLDTLREHVGDMTYLTPRQGSPTAPLFAEFMDMAGDVPGLKGHVTIPDVLIAGGKIAANPGNALARGMQRFEGFRNIHGRQMLELQTPEQAAVSRAALEQWQQQQRNALMARMLVASEAPELGQQHQPQGGGVPW